MSVGELRYNERAQKTFQIAVRSPGTTPPLGALRENEKPEANQKDLTAVKAVVSLLRIPTRLMKQLILAGNRPEFEEYCRRNALVSDDAVFMETADQLKGITAGSFTFIKLENWHLNPITNTKEFWNFLSVQHPIFRDAN